MELLTGQKREPRTAEHRVTRRTDINTSGEKKSRRHITKGPLFHGTRESEAGSACSTTIECWCCCYINYGNPFVLCENSVRSRSEAPKCLLMLYVSVSKGEPARKGQSEVKCSV